MSNNTLQSYLWWSVAVLLLIVVALWGNKYKNSLSLASQEIIAVAELEKNCNLRQAPCVAHFMGDETVSLEMTPKSIPLLKPLQLIATLRNNSYPNPVSIDVQFEGINMEMPFIWSTLKQSGQQYRGKAILPVCTQKRMEWEARVSIHTPKGIKLAVFPFYTIKQ